MLLLVMRVTACESRKVTARRKACVLVGEDVSESAFQVQV